MPFAGYYDEVVYSEKAGSLLVHKNADVHVKNLNGTDAVLYSAKEMVSTNVVPNPTKSDGLGNLKFRAALGEYDLVVRPLGGNWLSPYRVSTQPDPAEILQLPVVAMPRRAGTWQTSPASSLALGTALTLDRAYWMPFPIAEQARFDALGAWANTAVAGALYTLGLYASTAEGLPGARLEVSGALNAATAGNVQYVFPAVRTLSRGLYWVALVNTGAANQSVGYSAATNEWVTHSGNSLSAACFILSGTTALANPAPTLSSLSTQAMFVNVLLRVAP